jgi:hypothetical protein
MTEPLTCPCGSKLWKIQTVPFEETEEGRFYIRDCGQCGREGPAQFTKFQTIGWGRPAKKAKA